VVALLTDIPATDAQPPRRRSGVAPAPILAWRPRAAGPVFLAGGSHPAGSSRGRVAPTARPAPPGLAAAERSQRGPADRPGSAVFRRRRLAAAGLLAVLVAGSWIGLQAALGRIGGGPLATTGAPGGLQPAAARTWVVQPGDTLWSIAEAVDPKGDVRPLVDRMAAELGSTSLYPGERVAVPAG
jgi:nucleoid-associated protein YgaU